MTQFKSIDVTHHGHLAIVSFRLTPQEGGNGRDDALREDLRRLVEPIQTTRVIVNLGNVANCSSGTLGALIETQKQLARRSGRLCLCRLNDHLHEKLHTLNLEHTVFTIYESEAEAITAFHG